MVPPTHLAGANTEQERGHGKSSDTNKNNSHYNATSCQPASGKTPANAQVARHCRSLGRRPPHPAPHETPHPAPGPLRFPSRVGPAPGSLPVTPRPPTGVTFMVPAGQRPGSVSAHAPARLDRTAFSPSGRWGARFFDPCFFHGTCMPSHPRHQPLAPLAGGKAWRLALAPLALCLAQAAPAQTATETATEAATETAAETATEASATTPPRLQEVRISADTDNGMGFAPDQAQTAGKAPLRRLETPQSVSVVTREQMESRQIPNLQQALQTVAGVSPVNFGRRGFDDIHIRGFRSTESVLVDGLVQNTDICTKPQPTPYHPFQLLKD